MRYPAVELFTALAFVWLVRQFGPTPEAAKMCAFGAMLIALVVTDFEKRLLPDELTLGGLAIGILISPFILLRYRVLGALVNILLGLNLPEWAQSLIEAALGAVLPAFALWFVGWAFSRVRGREGLGLGDVKLTAMIGAFLGMQNALMTLLIGAVVGSVLGYAFIKLSGHDPSEYELPFGSFIGAAALVVSLAGPRLLG